ncbi:hypothetical protein [Micromonospora sp. NPDC023633]|uniref:hypothetical protein n=1 Tax=Micromonospora sp. NPDC023633 TaxID=3154320 RepID=UPI0033EFF317
MSSRCRWPRRFGRSRREIRTLKILTISTGIDLPHAAQALQIRRRQRRARDNTRPLALLGIT